MNKKGQLDLGLLEEEGFWILGGMAVAATIVGYIMSKRMEWVALPLWQLIVIIVVEIIAAAIFTLKG